MIRLSEMQSDFWWMVIDLMNRVRPLLEGEGIIIKPTELNRTIEVQKKYFKEGRSTTLRSKHLKNLAIDFALIQNGKFLRTSMFYKIIADHWKRLGGVWGGDWEFKDIYHFEYSYRKRTERLK